MDIKDRIAKLLALSTSPNAHEAEAAMLKAKELMVEYKLTLMDFERAPQARVTRFYTDIVCSKRRDAWAAGLAAIIAKNYCCRSFIIRYKGRQTANVALTGYEEDALVCYAVLLYALRCVHLWIDEVKDRCGHLYTLEDMRAICDSYARGFTRGVEAAFKKQLDEHKEWGIVLAIPQEAQDIVDSLKKQSFHSTSQNIPNMYNAGFRDGARFEPANKLESGMI